jgi:uncharacterized membrane protein YgcG
MRKLIIKHFVFLFLLLPAVFFNSCYEETSSVINTDGKLILDAQKYFEAEVLPLNSQVSNNANLRRSYRGSLSKNVKWNNASTKSLTVGTGVVVPITFSEPLYAKRGDNTSALSINNTTYLLIYTGTDKLMHAEMVTSLPDENYLSNSRSKKSFSGIAIVEDWQGNFLKGYHYLNGAIRRLSYPSIGLSSAKVVCIITDWFTCVATEYGQSCTYNYTETICQGSGGDDGGPTGGGGTGGGDYEGGGGSGGGDNADTNVTLEEDVEYTCPRNFTFVSVTTNNLWQEASLVNIHCDLIYWVGNTGERAIRRVEIAQLFFGLPYYNIEDELVYTQEQAAVISTNALNQAEYDMRNHFKENPSATSYELQQYWIERTKHYMNQESNYRGRVDRTGSSSPSTPVPIREYDPCL